MATIQDIANRVGVSKAAVSLYIKDNHTSRVGAATKEKIEEVIRELNYRPHVIARSLSNRRTNIIGVMIPYNGPLFRSTFVNEALSGIQEILFKHNYSMLFLPTSGEDSPTMVGNQLQHARGYDGLIVFGTRYCSMEDLKTNVEQLENSGVPFATVNMPEIAGRANQAILTNPLPTHPLRFLIDNGHRELLLVLGRVQSSDTIEAIEIYRQFCDNFDIPFEEDRILYGDYERDVAKSTVSQVLRGGISFSAVWCLSDTMAMGVYEALQEQGISIPDQVSVIGTNDSFFSQHMNPPLTTLRRKIFDSGRAAASGLLQTIDTDIAGRKVYLESELIMRSSVRINKNG